MFPLSQTQGVQLSSRESTLKWEPPPNQNPSYNPKLPQLQLGPQDKPHPHPLLPLVQALINGNSPRPLVPNPPKY
jgi:hypothetical protein